MRRREHHGRAGARERVDADAAVVDLDRHHREAGVGGDRARLGVARVLERDPAHAGRRERAADEAEPLPEPAGDDDLLRRGGDAADAAEVVGERRAQHGDAARVAVAEVVVGHGRERRAQRAQPASPREGGDVGRVRAEVEPSTRGRGRGLDARRRAPGHGAGDVRPRALAQGQVALGGELRVGVGHDLARDAELTREVAHRRHARAGLERAATDGAPDLVLDLRPERRRAVAAQREQEIDRLTGTLHSVMTGPCADASGP